MGPCKSFEISEFGVGLVRKFMGLGRRRSWRLFCRSKSKRRLAAPGRGFLCGDYTPGGRFTEVVCCDSNMFFRFAFYVLGVRAAKALALACMAAMRRRPLGE